MTVLLQIMIQPLADVHLVDPVAGFTREVYGWLWRQKTLSRPLREPTFAAGLYEAPSYSFAQDTHDRIPITPWRSLPSPSPDWDNSVCGRLFRDGLCLPSGAGLSDGDVERVVGVIQGLVGRK